MPQLHRAWSCTMLMALACDSHVQDTQQVIPVPVEDSIDERPVERAAEPPPPITGGTLLVTRDVAFAIASDPDRDLVHVVDLERNEETATIALAHHARPFRVTEDAAGFVHVTLRGSGHVVAIDPDAGQIVSTTYACPNPRGVAYHEGRNAILVACAGGDLVAVDADGGGVLERRWVAMDLRDVFVLDGATYVSRFRTAEVLEVRDDAVVHAGAPISPSISSTLRIANTAWRTLAMQDGGWVMLHQFANTHPLPAPAPRMPDEDGGSGSGDDGGDTDAEPRGSDAGYGGGPDPCDGATNPALSRWEPDGRITSTGPIVGLALAVDIAITPDLGRVVVASPSQHDEFRQSTMHVSLTRWVLSSFSSDPVGGCSIPDATPLAVGDFIAVAFAPGGELIAQTRSDPQLRRFSEGAELEAIDLAGDEIVDTGHDLFHLDTGGGLACASCHPEGGDDGRVWAFDGHGPRRTQALDAGLRGTEPFHWGGDMQDLPMLAHEVRHRRMGGALLTDERIGALQEWLFAIPQPNHERDGDDPDAAKGAALFTELGCRTCHAGPAFTNNSSYDFGRGPLQIPNLRGIALRPPYMHDGRCEDLMCAVREMVEATRPERAREVLPFAYLEELSALVAYLETL